MLVQNNVCQSRNSNSMIRLIDLDKSRKIYRNMKNRKIQSVRTTSNRTTHSIENIDQLGMIRVDLVLNRVQ